MTASSNSSIIQELRASYLDSLASKRAEFAEAMAARQFKTIARLGHQMKGSGCSYGLPEISNLGARMEEAAENRRLTVLEPLLAEFTNFMDETTKTQTLPENS